MHQRLLADIITAIDLQISLANAEYESPVAIDRIVGDLAPEYTRVEVEEGIAKLVQRKRLRRTSTGSAPGVPAVTHGPVPGVFRRILGW